MRRCVSGGTGSGPCLRPKSENDVFNNGHIGTGASTLTRYSSVSTARHGTFGGPWTTKAKFWKSLPPSDATRELLSDFSEEQCGAMATGLAEVTKALSPCLGQRNSELRISSNDLRLAMKPPELWQQGDRPGHEAPVKANSLFSREAERLPHTDILIYVILNGVRPLKYDFYKEISCVFFEHSVF